MKCPKCRFENSEGRKFCNQCGNKLEATCPKCGDINPPGSKFCGECGTAIESEGKLSSSTFEPVSLSSAPPTDTATNQVSPLDGERKHATVLFSDLSGYSAMAKKLDPERVKDIMDRIFTEAGKIADKYEGTVERFFGDEIMVLLGVPKAHEDDPVRAINMAIEIHERVAEISPEFEKETGVDLQMHIGINTGLVVTGDKYIGKRRHGLTGDTINMAKRLTGLATSGEIVVGLDTYRQASGYFDFETLDPTTVKGKSQPVQVFRVISLKERPSKTHRLTGLRADLTGRKAEMTLLGEAVDKLREGEGAIISICGDVGTGKSRLVEEFKATLDLEIIQWRQGCAYPYAQNIPYFPLIDLLSQAFQIEKSDSAETIKRKIEYTVEYLGEKKQSVVPFVGSLFSLRYPEVESINPQFWKARLHEAMKTILAALVQKAPTVICCEDLQWADPSSVELLRFVLSESRYPALFLLVYRPTFTLFSTYQLESISYPYQEIRLQDLSPTDAQNMMESLLDTESLPGELRHFIQAKVEGNPFYLEEVINSLIESGALVPDKGAWRLPDADQAVSRLPLDLSWCRDSHQF